MLNEQTLLKEIDGLNRFAIKLCKNKDDADDLVQTTIVKALSNRDKFIDEAKPFSWLSKIMYNTFVTGYNRKTRYESQYDPEPLLLATAVDSTQENNVMVKEVANAMQHINPQHKEILILVCAYEMSYEEVAEKLNIPLGTVRSRLSRAREALISVMAQNDNAKTNTQMGFSQAGSALQYKKAVH